MVEQVSKEIIRSIKRHQNGDISDAMKRMGLNYGINYGVSIPQLRQMANQYNADFDLANHLLNTKIREAKILSSMLFNVENITTDQLIEISRKVENMELVEQFSRNMYASITNLNLLLPVLSNGNTWQKLLAVYSASWCVKINAACPTKVVEWGIEQINSYQDNDDKMAQKAVGFLFQSLASINGDYKKQMVILAEKMLKSDNAAVQALAQEFLWLNMG